MIQLHYFTSKTQTNVDTTKKDDYRSQDAPKAKAASG